MHVGEQTESAIASFPTSFPGVTQAGGGRWSVNYQPVLGTGMGSTPQVAAAVQRGRVHDRRIGEGTGAAGCEITFSITCRM